MNTIIIFMLRRRVPYDIQHLICVTSDAEVVEDESVVSLISILNYLIGATDERKMQRWNNIGIARTWILLVCRCLAHWYRGFERATNKVRMNSIVAEKKRKYVRQTARIDSVVWFGDIYTQLSGTFISNGYSSMERIIGGLFFFVSHCEKCDDHRYPCA